MSGETARQESGWSVDTLKHHFDDLRQADKDALAIAAVGVILGIIVLLANGILK